MALFADVVLPVPLPRAFTYLIPAGFTETLLPGMRVVARLGKRLAQTGLVVKVHNNQPAVALNELEGVLDDAPIVPASTLSHWQWLTDYYLCAPGEVLQAALPAGLRISVEGKLVPLVRELPDWLDPASHEARIVGAAILQGTLPVKEVENLLGIKSYPRYIKKAIDHKLVAMAEEIHESYKPRTEMFVRLSADYEQEDTLRQAFDMVARAPRQEAMLMQYIRLSQRYGSKPEAVRKGVLLRASSATASTLQALVQKGIFEEYQEQVGRIAHYASAEGLPPLSPHQQKALTELKACFATKEVALLHGITGSGKTTVYLHLIKEQVNAGKQVLYLLPEIALTTQMIVRLQRALGDCVCLYHSRINSHERTEIWQELLKRDSKIKVVIGARSAVMLPFINLGLCVIDEEHDSSYKQQEPAPRYSARDAALVLAKIHGCKTVLGSATPGVETFWMAREKHYGYVELSERFGDAVLPKIEFDRIVAPPDKGVPHLLGEALRQAIREAVERREQAILFINRRGYNALWTCHFCGWVKKCDQCDVSLTYHKWSHKLQCHYCGRRYAPPTQCESCGHKDLRTVGAGTQKVEEELALIFPELKVARVDLDSARSKQAFQQVMDDFQDGQIDILVGTQMVTKGLDFGNVTLVGVIDADGLLAFPDFRTHERAFQLLAQVSGRAGRASKPGRVLIQTRNPEHPVLKLVVEHNYLGLFDLEIAERKRFGYPPFNRMAKLVVRHRQLADCEALSADLAHSLREQFGEQRVFGPEFPLVRRVKNYYLRQIYVKLERKYAHHTLRERLFEVSTAFLARHRLLSRQLIIDMDPR